jgi:hypothetical protein
MQKLRGILVAILVGAVVFAFVTLWLHAVLEAAIAISSVVGIAVLLVVGTRTDSHDEAADAAWLDAAPDLPPASDRRRLEESQRSMAGPEPGPRGAAPASGVPSGDLLDPGAGI